MQPITAEFEDALKGTNTPVVTVTVGDTTLDVIDGSVTFDSTATTRASCSLTVAVSQDDLEFGGLIPDAPEDLLAPYGNEVVIQRGLEINGEAEMVPLGIFRIDEVEVTESNDGQVQMSISGMDRSIVLIDAVFEKAGQIPAGQSVYFWIIALGVLGYAPETLPVSDDLFVSTVPTPFVGWEAGDDRWDFMLGLAEAANGAELFFDQDGKLALRDTRKAPPPVWEFTEGEDATLLGVGKRWSREDAVNRVLVEGENGHGDPIYGEARDQNRASPTYYGGSFGKKTLVYSSEWVTEQGQANDVAARILSLYLGTHQEISFEALVHPALEPNDVVLVSRPQLGINEYHVIDTLTIPLTLDGTMSCTTRRYSVTRDETPPPEPPPPPSGALARTIADTARFNDATIRVPKVGGGGGATLPPAGMSLAWSAAINAVPGQESQWGAAPVDPLVGGNIAEYRTGYALFIAHPTETSGIHTEFQEHNTAANRGGAIPGMPGATVYYEWEMYVPAYVEFPQDSDNRSTVNQFHGNQNAGYTGGFGIERGTDMLSIRVEGGYRKDSNNYEFEREWNVGVIPRNQWFKIGYHVKWDMRYMGLTAGSTNQNPTGFAIAYLNGVKGIDPAFSNGQNTNIATMGDQYTGGLGISSAQATSVMFRVGWYPQRVGPTDLEMRIRNVKVYK